MDIEKQIAYWKTGAAEDFEVAIALFEKGRTRHALFFAELSLEKILKAHVVNVTQEIPPRTHDLLRLADIAGIELKEDQRNFLAEFQQYCLEGRYPETLGEPPADAETKVELDACQRMLEWLTNQFE